MLDYKFNRVSILIVDDDQNILNMFKRILRSHEFQKIELCSSAEEALRKIVQQEFAIVVSDYQMPEMNGIDLLEQVRKISPSTIRIILTGCIEDAKIAREAINRAGVYRFLSKPWKIEELIDIFAGAARQYEFDRRLVPEPTVHADNSVPVMEKDHDSIQDLIDSSVDATLIVDMAGKVCAMNRQAEIVLDRPRSELVGEPFGYHGSPGDEKEIMIYRHDGRTTIGHMRILSTEWQGDCARMMVIRDITESAHSTELRTRIAEEMRVSRMKDDFVSMVSHELRTPLTIIGGVIYNLLEGCAGEMNTHQKKLCSIADRNVKRLTTLINNILDLSRYERGQVKTHKRRVDIEKIMQNLVAEYKLSGKSGSIKLELAVRLQRSHVFIDPDLFVQVMNNLVGNAIKHARGTVRIVITESRDTDKIPAASQEAESVVHVSVIDDGEGIPQEKLGTLFSKFVQITRKDDDNGYKGTGLGLSISRMIVDLCGGVIWAESEQGAGSRFNVVLPNVPDDRMFELFIQSTQQESDLKGSPVGLVFLIPDQSCLEGSVMNMEKLMDFVEYAKPRLGLADMMVHLFETPNVVILESWLAGSDLESIAQQFSDLLSGYDAAHTGSNLAQAVSIETRLIQPVSDMQRFNDAFAEEHAQMN